MKPDFSEYLKRPGKFDIEERDWLANPGKHDWHANIVNEFIVKNNIKSITEIGCGTGELYRRIKAEIEYIGYDSNEDCISLARRKTGFMFFIEADIRNLIVGSKNDLVMCFTVMKHFGLHEWYDIFKKISSFGKYFIFDMPIADATKDDGVDFHHVWKSMGELRNDIENVGLVLIGYDASVNPLEPVFICKRII